MPIAIPDVKEKKANPKGFNKPPAKKASKPKSVPVKVEPAIKLVTVPNVDNNIEKTVKIEHNIPKHVVPPWEDLPVKKTVQEERKSIKFDDMLKAMQQPAPEIPPFMKR